MTRGMEFDNTRIDGTVKAYFSRPMLYETPTFGWLEAKAKKTARYLALMASVPDGFRGVGDITLDDTHVIVHGIGLSVPLRIAYQSALFDHIQ